MQIDIPKTNLEYSESLLNFLEKDNDSSKLKKKSDIPARSDARFLGQSKRVCCVRNKNIKIIYSYDENKFSYNYISGLKEKEINLSSQNKSIKEKFKYLKIFLKKTDYLPYESFRKKFYKKIVLLINYQKEKPLNIVIFSNSLIFFEKIIISIFNELSSQNNLFRIRLISKNKINLTNFPKLNFLKKDTLSYDIKIFLQTDSENNESDLKYFKDLNASKSSIITCSLTGEITQKRFLRALKTIWYSRIYYIYEPLLIIKLLRKFLKNK